MSAAHPYLAAIETSAPYWAALFFFAFYPIGSSVMWTVTNITYYLRREFRKKKWAPALEQYPAVSVLIPCYHEELHIEETLANCLRLNYPDYEVVVVDDGSADRTVEKVLPYVADGRVRLIAKTENEGKAMALNDAIPCLQSEIVVIIDADSSPEPEMLSYIVPHFSSARVAAVTGNPRVVEKDTFLAKLQTIEFTSIVSILRRAQRVWGRILTVSGVATAFRKSALVDVGFFSPDMATEDIDMTWKLQKRYYDVRYEPGAIVWMRVPKDLRGLWKQRRRWALGLAQVLRRHGKDVLFSWKRRRMWPILFESSLSVLWAYTFVVLTILWAVSYSVGYPPAGASPIPNWWGMLIATLCIVQLGTGVLLDKRYDREIVRYFPVSVYYPLVYWMLMAVVTVVSTPRGLFGTSNLGVPTRWRTKRE